MRSEKYWANIHWLDFSAPLTIGCARKMHVYCRQCGRTDIDMLHKMTNKHEITGSVLCGNKADINGIEKVNEKVFF